MRSRRNLATVLAVLMLAGTGRAEEESSGRSGAAKLVLKEFDGASPNGKWEPHQAQGPFQYTVKPDALVMVDRRNANQHVTRRGFELDPKRQYAIEAVFTIHERTVEQAPNSFCLNFHVAGPIDSFDSLSCWSMNVDVAAKKNTGGVMKHMGFVGGRFRQMGERKVAWASTGVEYLLRVEVNTDADGRPKPKTITVTVMEGKKERERFEVDYAPFPYQPEVAKPVRIGVNTHGADWTMRNLSVWTEP
ncbi:MAG: hypothetical protein HQ582_26120 [Planctomycetes bacterium]|nr:hypothetical protein [Planctomycetota bacterium]